MYELFTANRTLQTNWDVKYKIIENKLGSVTKGNELTKLINTLTLRNEIQNKHVS